MKNLLSILIILIFFQLTQAQEKVRFKHILITNDDGIEDDDRLWALAKSVINVADRVSIVVSAWDRSGTSNHTTFGKHQSTLEVKCLYRAKEDSITQYIVPGNPGDNVILGLNGLFPDDRPDLVLSGINGGSNIGPDWFGSGTIGAIRMAAFLGVKGIALSGFEDHDNRSFELIPHWITQFISSGILDEIDKNSYLTIGFPEIPLEEIKGVKVAKRRISFDKPEFAIFYKIHGEDPHTPKNRTIWAIKIKDGINDTTIYDDTYLQEGYIIITPMTINENNNLLIDKFIEKKNIIPEFSLK